MTRKEEIKIASEDMGLWQVGSAMFQLGAEWADAHPRKGLVDIEKVCEWLKKGGYFVNNTETMEDFRKAMEK